MNEKLLYELFLPRQAETVETIVREILPRAVGHCYSEQQIKKLFKGVPKDMSSGPPRLPFSKLQDIILADQQRRLKTLIHGGAITVETRQPIPYQTLPGKILSSVVKNVQIPLVK